jgi:hypothetical protein
MRWMTYFFLSLPMAVLGLLGAGFVANAAVRWYRVSSFEGKSGFFVVGWALAGAVVAFVASLVILGMLRPQEGAGYLRGLGVVTGVLAGVFGLVALASWGLADIPPEIDGQTLTLEIELKLPVTVKEAPATNGAELKLHALAGNTLRVSENGRLFPAKARLEEGRWIVPGEVFLFTKRGQRMIAPVLTGVELTGFLVSIPGRPGREFLEWSDWKPRPQAPNPPWPETKASYRFRVRM